MRPLIMLGGHENTLALVRSIGRLDSKIYVLASAHCPANWSRYCNAAFSPGSGQSLAEHWYDILLDAPDERLNGGIIFACNDEAISFIRSHHQALGGRYRLEENDPELRFRLLDKKYTLARAREAGLSAPSYWDVDKNTDVDAILEQVRFPVLIKPIYSHIYRAIFHRKLTLVDDPPALRAHLREVRAADVDVMICEYIPGPDSLLCSHYTYIDKEDRYLFDFTKRVIRRWPKNFGGGCYHITDWAPDVAEAGRRFFAGIGLKGLGNIEFKRDPRDGELKVIECNPRFTGAHQLLVDCGMDIGRIVYDILDDRSPVIPPDYRHHHKLIYLYKDFQAYRQLKKLGELKFHQWLTSILQPHSVPVFSFSDPAPAFFHIPQTIKRKLSKR